MPSTYVYLLLDAGQERQLDKLRMTPREAEWRNRQLSHEKVQPAPQWIPASVFDVTKA